MLTSSVAAVARSRVGAMVAGGCGLALMLWACNGREAHHHAEGSTDAGLEPAASADGANNRDLQRADQSTFGTDLTVSITGPNELAVGDRVELGVTISNDGPGLAIEFQSDIQLPPQLKFSASSANCQEYRPPGGISCTLPQIEAGHSFDFTISADVTGRPTNGTLAVAANVNLGPVGVVDTDPSNNATELRITMAEAP
jgi:hypothetical protein